jgi:PST family polysaccharide transporter
MPRHIFALEAFKLTVLGVGICTLGRAGPLWTCCAVGIGFGAHALASLGMVRLFDGIPLRSTVGSMVPAAVASLVMALAVLAMRSALQLSPALTLPLEIGTGALVYFLTASVVARDAVRDLTARLKEALRHESPQTTGDVSSRAAESQ